MTSRSSSAPRKSARRARQRKPTVQRRRSAANQTPASCRNGIWPISMPASTRRKSARDLDQVDAECIAFEADYKGKLADADSEARRRQVACRGGQALRGDRRSRRPARLLCRPDSCRRQRRSGDLQILRRRLRAADGGVGASVVLRARTQPHRRCRDRARDADAGTRRIIGRGSRICARTSRISSRIASSNCSTRNPRAAMPPGTGCSTRPFPACASRSGARSWRSSRR